MYTQELKKIINYYKFSKCTEQWLTIYGRNVFLINPGNPSLAHQEVVSDIMYEPPTKKSRSLTASIINAEDNGNLSGKITIKQEEGYVDYSTKHVEEVLLETLKLSANSSNK